MHEGENFGPQIEMEPSGLGFGEQMRGGSVFNGRGVGVVCIGKFETVVQQHAREKGTGGQSPKI